MPPGQKVLQSILVRLFANTGSGHAWDPLRGRRLAGLFDYYGTWISPQAGRIIMGSTVAHRMCAYLLPYTDPRTDQRFPRCAGLPGLRLTAYTKRGYQLVHLPTNTPVEIHDDASRCSPKFREEVLDVERRMHRAEEEESFRSAWREPKLTDIEHLWASVWQPQPHTDLTSALFCAQSIFLQDPTSTRLSGGGWARHLQLSCSPHPEAPSVLVWCDGLRPTELGGHLEALGVVPPGSARIEEAGVNYATIALNDSARLEMHRRHLCALCHLDTTFALTRAGQRAA